MSIPTISDAPLGSGPSALATAGPSFSARKRSACAFDSMVLRGALGDHEAFGDLPVGEALGDQLGDLSLARAQRYKVRAPPEVGDERAGALGVGRHAERAGQAVGLSGGGRSTVRVAGSVAGGERRRQVVAGFADEPVRPCTVGLFSGVRQIVNGHVEAAESDGPAAEGELNRTHVGDPFADHVLAAERVEPVE